MNGENKRFTLFLTAFFCAAALSIGAVFCVITAFCVPVSGWTLAGWIIALSAAFSFLCGCRHGWIGLLVLTLAAAGAGYYGRLALYASLSVAVETISSVYASAFDTLQTVTLLPTEPGATATACFAVFGAVLSLVTAWTVRGQKMLWLAAVCGILPLVLCLVILQSVPAVWAVMLLVGALALLLLSQQLRRVNASAGGTLALALLMPLAALMLVLYAAFPAEGYTRSEWSESLRPKVNDIADKLTIFRTNETTGQVQLVSPFSPSTLGGRVWDLSVKKANLNRVGPQRLNGQHVMRVFCDAGTIRYLRGCSLGIYEDNQWLAVDESAYASTEIPEDVMLVRGDYQLKQVKIETDMKSSVFYTPYMMTDYPVTAAPVYDAYVKNPLQETQYSVDWAWGFSQTEQNPATRGEYRAFVYDQYTQLPPELEAYFREAYGETPPIAVSYRPDALLTVLDGVGMIVQNGKTYDLNTPSVPEGEDFVTWFLSESDTGYCVHFATAATMLLRYYGVPARYVTGYSIQAKSGEWTDVTQDDAHAWVEYYRDDFGWLSFDPTPAASDAAAEPEEQLQNDNLPEPPEKKEEFEEQIEDNKKNETANINENQDILEVNKKNVEPQKTKTGTAWLLRIVCCALILAAILFVWRIIVLSARMANFTRGSTNRRAVHYYRHIVLLARLGKAEIPEELEQLAQKARFSQHKLSDGELLQFAEFADSLTQTLINEAKPLQRAIYRLIYVLQ